MADTLLESLAWSCNGFLLRIEDPLQVLLAVVLLPLGADTLLESLAWSCNGFLLRSEDSLQVLLAVVLLPLGADTLLESPAKPSLELQRIFASERRSDAGPLGCCFAPLGCRYSP